MFLCGDLYCILGYHNNVVELASKIKITFHAYCVGSYAVEKLVIHWLKYNQKIIVACFTIFPYVLNSFGVTAL